MVENSTIEEIRSIPNSVVGSDKSDILSELVKTLRATQISTERVWLLPFRHQVDDVMTYEMAEYVD